jgi:hypothetical protein
MNRKPGEMSEERTRRRRRRSVSVAEISDFLEYLAPPWLSVPEEPWGLQAGSSSAEVKTVVVSPMPTQSALSTAASRKQSLLLTCAPLLTTPIMAVRLDDPVGAKLSYLLENRISFYVLPNSFAAAPGGFDDALAERLGLAATSMLRPTNFEPQYKIAVFTPRNAVERVRNAAAEAGAGNIGNYSHCSFETQGRGTFLPREGAEPTIGAVGRMETVEEIRIEMVVPQRELQGVIAAVLDAHPYEEVAYDVYVIRNPGVVYGRGRMGELPLTVAMDTVLAQVQDALETDSIRCSHHSDFPVSSLAVASGACDGLFWQARRSGAGAFITGSASPQDFALADSGTTVIIDVGYAASLSPGLQQLCMQLRDTFDSDGVEILYVQ